MFNETATLVLKHSDISITGSNTVSNTVGSWSNGRQKSTWNLNLKNLLSNTIYDENDMFVLRLNQLSYAQANFPATTFDQQIIINVSGLNWNNSGYDVKTGNNTTRNQMLILNMATNAAVINFSPNIALACFKKSAEDVQITIELLRTSDNLPANYTGTTYFPPMVYNFDIYAVK
jgi:hypothetical protein